MVLRGVALAPPAKGGAASRLAPKAASAQPLRRFRDGVRGRRPRCTKEDLVAAFKKFDVSGDGTISPDELKKILGRMARAEMALRSMLPPEAMRSLYRAERAPAGRSDDAWRALAYKQAHALSAEQRAPNPPCRARVVDPVSARERRSHTAASRVTL